MESIKILLILTLVGLSLGIPIGKIVNDLEQIKEADDNSFSLDSWQDCIQSLEKRDNNRRVIPDSVNGIHIIDGIECRYSSYILSKIKVTLYVVDIISESLTFLHNMAGDKELLSY